jgi:hypothetical protein
MKRLIVAFGLCCLISAVAHAQDKFYKPYGSSFLTTSAVYWAGVAADIQTSRHGQEGNSLLQNQRGGIHVGKAIGYSVPGYVLVVLLEKKHPKLAFWAGIAVGAARAGIAVRNTRVH